MEETHNNKDKKGWIFVIEDDVFINKAYGAKFAHENIAIKTAEDGEDALKTLHTLKKDEMPVLILLDLMLPKTNGFEVLEAIKKDPNTKDIPVIILSNLAQEADAKRGVELGAKEYLVKANTKIENIIAKVREYLPKA